MVTLHRRIAALAMLIGAACLAMLAEPQERQWLAGDSHVHSHWSPGYDRTKSPPEPVKGADAVYSTPTNARMARQFGLRWMVTTDHGGPNHSKLNLTEAYAELKASRVEVPEVLQFYGMELNMPAMDHHTLIVPSADDEWKTLFNIESQFDANEAWPADPSRNSETAAFQALTFMKSLPRLPLMFANHPSRSATGIRRYGLDDPREFRNYANLAPEVYHGMEGAPGHQAAGLAPDGSPKRDAAGRPAGARGSYGHEGAGTMGGFDQMTAIVGGFWDSLLGEGRRFWIVATSDSHANYADTEHRGSDFWPGQYQKTYVRALASHGDILDGLRQGRIFASAGDLVTELDVTADGGGAVAQIGGTLAVRRGDDVTVTIRFRDPETPNAHGDNPTVRRMDVIVGDVRGPAPDRNADTNDTARVYRRFTDLEWTREGDVRVMSFVLPAIARPVYVRVRGTNTVEGEPSMDALGEDPWLDLWCYSNPVFIEAR